MDDGMRPRAVWRELVAVLAAASVGMVVAAGGFPLALHAAFTDVLVEGPMGPGVYAAAVLAMTIAVPALLPQQPGWPVAAAGLAVLLVGDLAAADAMRTLLPMEAGTTPEVVTAFVVTSGLGLALGGVLLALVQASPSASPLVGAAVAGGLVLHAVGAELIRAMRPDRAQQGAGAPTTETATAYTVDVQLWLALALVVAAAVTHSRWLRNGAPASVRLRPGVPLAVLAVAALMLVGLAVRMRVIQGSRPDPDAGPDVLAAYGDRVTESFAQVSSVVLATAVALLLAYRAYRVGGVTAARWVSLGGAVAPIAVFMSPDPDAPIAAPAVFLLLFGLLAVAGGALAARYAARLLPWDAFGLVIAAAATAFAPPVARAGEVPADRLWSVLLAVGLGLALGSGIVLVTGSSATPPGVPAAVPMGEPAGRARDTSADRAGVLVLGPAAMVLCATALAPVVVRSKVDGLVREDPSFTVPLYTVAGAALLILLFGFARAADPRRRDPAAEASASRS